MAKREIIWTKRATHQLIAIIEYVKRDSPQNASSVNERILKKIGELTDDTIVHRKDPYKKNNDGNYLYFEFLKYRIVYYVESQKVFIIRIRHTNMEPKKY